MKITGNEPINPLHPDSSGNDTDRSGLTIRQHFAAMAMQGFASIYLSQLNNSTKSFDNPNGMANLSVLFADALIEELNKDK